MAFELQWQSWVFATVCLAAQPNMGTIWPFYWQILDLNIRWAWVWILTLFLGPWTQLKFWTLQYQGHWVILRSYCTSSAPRGITFSHSDISKIGTHLTSNATFQLDVAASLCFLVVHKKNAASHPIFDVIKYNKWDIVCKALNMRGHQRALGTSFTSFLFLDPLSCASWCSPFTQ